MVATTSKGKLLTEAELLAMPEDDYMNPAQLEFFRLRLTKMRDELLENALWVRNSEWMNRGYLSCNDVIRWSNSLMLSAMTVAVICDIT